MRLVAALCALLAACAAPVAQPTPTPASEPLAAAELKYRVFDQVGRPWYCDPDFYPVARADELELARQREAEMRADAVAFGAILRHNGLAPGLALTAEQLLAVYRDWKQLRALELEPAGASYRFSLRVESGSKQGELVEGTIDQYGRISVAKRTDVGPPICPICLAETVRIATPSGPVPVTSVRVGTVVWSVGASGERIAVPVRELASVEAPAGHEVLRIALADGRAVTASPGHPGPDGRPIATLRPGDLLDGSVVTRVERLPYRGRTYDLRPDGPTGRYWADGVLLSSGM